MLVNRLRVSSATQVSLRVRVAEVSREVTKLFGINWDAVFTPGDFVFGLATGRDFLVGNTITRLESGSGLTGSILGGYSNGSANVNALIDALERESLVTVLAEPNLTALSGETASFLAGGEFPIPVGRDNDEIEIEFKEFGVSLAFTPTVLGPDRISLRVRPEVSDLSPNGAIKLGDLQIPAISTRRAETTVELGSGQSFAIGGLLSNETRTNLEKLPGLGDLPVLGALFRSSEFRQSESELVIIVTPYLVRPTMPSRLRTPVDGFVPASDLERLIEARFTSRSAASADGHREAHPRLHGPAGFIVE
jgi:pilus assembly protein CpaC